MKSGLKGVFLGADIYISGRGSLLFAHGGKLCGFIVFAVGKRLPIVSPYDTPLSPLADT
jgi:hypothetical protein